MKNYYKTLGIRQASTKEEIKKAFRELAFKYHPDKNTDQRFSEQFKEINEAKQVLLDDFKKFQYDNMLIHFLSKNKVVPGFKDYRRRKPFKRSFEFHILKETILNKFFIGSLFAITILLTIAFFKIPAEEPTLDSPFIEKPVSQLEKEPLKVKPEIVAVYTNKKAVEKQPFNSGIKKKQLKAKPAIATAYTDKKAIEKQLINRGIKKEQLKGKPVIRISYGGKKIVKRQPLKREIKKSALIEQVQKNKKVKPVEVSTSVALILNNEKVLEKQLTNAQMIQVLNDIKAEKEKHGNNSNCVQIIKTESSNIQNAFKLANFLRSNGFIISGREKIPASSNGINIDAKYNCIRVTIGTMNDSF
ncbi:MAG: heat shock protein DnaJ domain protein [Segetibacter sp.]|nr:heat shock protein DnaJ domain protein [Segetibacter sp.]